MTLPAWSVAIVHVPTVSMVRLPDGVTEHTEGVTVVKVTASPEEAVAFKASGVELNCCAPGLLKVIACVA